MANFLAILIGVVLVNHLALARLPAARARMPAGAVGTAVSLSLALTLAVAVTWLADARLLRALDLQELRLPTLILVTVGAAPLSTMPARLMSTTHGAVPGHARSFVIINCALLGAALLATRDPATLTAAMVSAFACGAGFMLLLTVFAGVQERLEAADIPPLLAGGAITLITAGLMSLAFSGVSGLAR